MAMRFLKSRVEPADHLRAVIAYGEHLLKQPVTLRKRQAMRYFALGFFHGGEVFDAAYSPRDRRLTIVLHSAAAVDNAWNLKARPLLRKGIPVEQVIKRVSVDRDAFNYRVTFTNVGALRMSARPEKEPAPFHFLLAGELWDASPDELPPGYTWLRMEFSGGRLANYMDVAFKACHVEPLQPKLVARYFGRTRQTYALLAGRDLKASLAARTAQWRKEAAAIRGRCERPGQLRCEERAAGV